MSAYTARLLLVGALVGVGIWQGAKMISTVRGLRNNNPGNIELGEAWQGAVPASEQTDPRFVQFTTPEYGIRAMAKILSSYANRGLVTTRSIISAWAPPTENNTASYINSVASNIGISPDAPLSRAQWPGLIAAIIRHENGVQPYDSSTIARGVGMA